MFAWKNLASLLILSVVWLAVSHGSAPAQDVAPSIEGAWFKLKQKQSGYEGTHAKWRRDRVRATVYLQLQTYDSGLAQHGDERFHGVIVAPVTAQADAYTTTPITLNVLTTVGNDNDVIVFGQVDDRGDVNEGDGLRLAFTARLTSRIRSNGSLRSAKLKSLGGYYVEKLNGDCWSGELSLMGATTAQEKLPFAPSPGGG